MARIISQSFYYRPILLSDAIVFWKLHAVNIYTYDIFRNVGIPPIFLPPGRIKTDSGAFGGVAQNLELRLSLSVLAVNGKKRLIIFIEAMNESAVTADVDSPYAHKKLTRGPEPRIGRNRALQFGALMVARLIIGLFCDTLPRYVKDHLLLRDRAFTFPNIHTRLLLRPRSISLRLKNSLRLTLRFFGPEERKRPVIPQSLNGEDW